MAQLHKKETIRVTLRSTYAVGTGDPGDGTALEIKPGTGVEELLRALPGLGPPEAFDDIMIHVFVNGRLRGFDYVLRPGDVIDLHIPVSGG